MKIVSGWLSRIATMFTLLVLAAAFVFVTPRLFGIDPYIVESGSMEPVIHTGSIAYINTRDTKASPGDIITFRVGDSQKLATHRISREENGQFFTKGDANDQEDLVPVGKEQIVGTYVYSVPKAGYILAKQERLLPALAFWIIGLNLLAMIAGAWTKS